MTIVITININGVADDGHLTLPTLLFALKDPAVSISALTNAASHAI